MNELLNQKSISKVLVILGTLLSLFIFVKFINEIKIFSTIGHGEKPINTIVVSGDGEVYASPDIATLSFSVRQTEKTVTLAQTEVEKKISGAFEFLSQNGVDKKDVQTTGTTFYPQYQYYDNVCRDNSCPPPRNPVITGYEMSETVSVKVRKIDDVGKIVSGLGNIGVTDLSGPNFAIDKEDDIKAQARSEAIKKAKDKANILAKDLGINLGGIVNFSESGNVPIIYGKAMSAPASMSVGGAMDNNISTSTGENKVTSSVTITYEIR